MRGQNLLRAILTEVGESGACMRLNARALIIECCHHSRNDLALEMLLKVSWHVVSELADAVEGSVSDLWVGVLNVLDYDWYHGSDFINLINVFADL